ncbi:MAG: hypothetical protein GC136_07790 [Alphaproteobacteria bacterium]|nr:hypothetical protein [Alphaproteobacteria bacterium]
MPEQSALSRDDDASLFLLSQVARIAIPQVELGDEAQQLAFVEETRLRIEDNLLYPEHYDAKTRAELLVYALSARLKNIPLEKAVVLNEQGNYSHICGEFVWVYHAEEVRDNYMAYTNGQPLKPLTLAHG